MSRLDHLAAQGRDLLHRLPAWAADPQLLVGGLGVLLLVAGQRLYRLAIVAPGLAAGAMVGLELTRHESTGLRLAAAAALALVAGFLLHKVERLAVAAAGAFLAVGATQALAPLVLHGPTPWFLLVGAGVLGLLLFPGLYRRLLLVITPAIGALCVAWAAGRPTDLLLIAGLTLGGIVIQLVLGRKGGKERDEG